MRIAVAYRHEDGGYGGRLVDDLGRRLTRDEVVPARPGADRDVLIAVVGPDWRVESREERVRRALEAAFRGGAGVVVVRLPDASIPASDVLPPSLARLGELDPVSASDEYWDATVGRVVELVQSMRRPARNGLWERVRRRPRLSIGAAVATVGGIVGILSSLGVLADVPPERGRVVVDPHVANFLTREDWEDGHTDNGDPSQSYPGEPGASGYGYEVRLTLDNPEGERYGLRWTARDEGQGRPLEGFRDVVWRTYAHDEVNGFHSVWVPCPPGDAVPFVVWFELTNESRPRTVRLERDVSPRGECRRSE